MGVYQWLSELEKDTKRIPDIVYRSISLSNGQGAKLVYISNLVDAGRLAEEVVSPLLTFDDFSKPLTAERATLTLELSHFLK
ncbi:spore germination protein [Bacillaceae bacterium SIJ1]|uniref:spore germination protein n=1 Tax=Litoribacterium kuwaitense TaxID=1398745 RepID=UPI0013EE0823|nr:spore germination protein [Litoribacterium kuwaitense]NGP44821.1 spore germination protein [Litoribacterium kuwaitense]